MLVKACLLTRRLSENKRSKLRSPSHEMLIAICRFSVTNSPEAQQYPMKATCPKRIGQYGIKTGLEPKSRMEISLQE